MSEEQETYDYSSVVDGPGDNMVGALVKMALDLKAAESEVERLTKELETAQDRMRQVEEFDLPKLMEQAGVDKFSSKLHGVAIEVKEVVRGSIPKANHEKALAWLDENKHGNLVKREFKIVFNKDEESWARKFMADLRKRKHQLSCEIKRAVAPQTLLAFIRRELEAGNPIPLDLFGVYRQRYAKVNVAA